MSRSSFLSLIFVETVKTCGGSFPSATEIEGTFRVNGSNKRMRELQAIFEAPPRVRVFPHTPAPYPHRHCGVVRQVARLES